MKRKTIHIGIILIGLFMTGCGSRMTENTEPSRVQIIETVRNVETNSEQVKAYPRMVKLKDRIYVDTGETSNLARCGVMDFSFDSSVKGGIPTKNNQTNFGKGYGGQYGMSENRIEICIDDTWHIFAYNENNFEGVEMKVIDNTNHSLTLEIVRNKNVDIQYGEAFVIEAWDTEKKMWLPVSYKQTDIAFEEVAYIVNEKNSGKWSVDWTDIYGELERGTYRIIKQLTNYKKAGENTSYTLTAEFQCK